MQCRSLRPGCRGLFVLFWTPRVGITPAILKDVLKRRGSGHRKLPGGLTPRLLPWQRPKASPSGLHCVCPGEAPAWTSLDCLAPAHPPHTPVFQTAFQTRTLLKLRHRADSLTSGQLYKDNKSHRAKSPLAALHPTFRICQLPHFLSLRV